MEQMLFLWEYIWKRHTWEKMQKMKIIALGGGGFTHGSHPELDDFCLSQVGKARPRLGYVGSASQDDSNRIARFHQRFAKTVSVHVHLAMSLDAQGLADRLYDLDMVYVGGGNTEVMVATWRANGWDRVLCDAARRGVILAGVSAGAVCWFDNFLYSAGAGPMRPLRGLGLVSGGACPHYSTETDRRAALHAAIASGTMPNSIAIDDGVAVVLDAAGPTKFCSAEPGACAYQVIRTDDGETLETKLLVPNA
jgi:dipeptidase E